MKLYLMIEDKSVRNPAADSIQFRLYQNENDMRAECANTRDMDGDMMGVPAHWRAVPVGLAVCMSSRMPEAERRLMADRALQDSAKEHVRFAVGDPKCTKLVRLPDSPVAGEFLDEADFRMKNMHVEEALADRGTRHMVAALRTLERTRALVADSGIDMVVSMRGRMMGKSAHLEFLDALARICEIRLSETEEMDARIRLNPNPEIE